MLLREDGAATAPVLLLIHGFPTASFDWAELWPALASRYRLLAPDLLGFGLSSKPAGHEYRIGEQADICEALLQAAGIADYHVLARQAPGRAAPRLHSVALLNGGLFPEVHRPLLTQKLLASAAGPLLARLMNRRTFAASMTRIFGDHTPPSPELLDGFWRLLNVNKGRQVLPQLIRYMEERRQNRERWVSALVKATIPLKLINGEADPISGGHMVARYRELVPAADVTVLAGIGHYPQCEAPSQVQDACLAFRDALPSS